MSKHTDNGGTAFPVLDSTLNDGRAGMTLRDYIAIAAMQGVARDHQTRSGLVKEAYQIADAMLAEREKSAVNQ